MVKFMSMAIGNNMGISTNYQSNTRKASETKNVREYSNYLKDKYSCLTPGKNVSISVTPGMLKKAMNDEKTEEVTGKEYSFKFKGTDLQSVTNSFVEKMEDLNAQMNSMNGFDVRV